MRRLVPMGIALALIASAGIGAAAAASPAPTRAARPAAPPAAPAVSAAVISGVVRDASTGALLGDVQVLAVPARTQEVGEGGLPLTRTDSKGRYRLTDLQAGVEYRVLADTGDGSPYPPVYAPGTPRRLAGTLVAAGGRADVRLPRGQAVTGTLRDAQGRRAAGREVVLLGADDAELRARALTDSQGRWRVYALPGRYVVVGEADATSWFAPGVDDIRRATVLTVRAGRVPAPLALRAPKPALVDVTMIDAVSQRPVAQGCARPGVEEYDPDSVGPGSSATVEPPAGTYRDCSTSRARQTVSVDPRTGLVEAGAPGHVDTLARAKARRGATVALTVALPRAGAITGRTLDAGGRPQPACVEAEDVGRPSADVPAADDCSLREGMRFVLEGLRPGRYRVKLKGDGGYAQRYAPDADSAATAAVYTVTAGKTLDIGTARLRAGGALAGRVLDVAGRPVAGAVVAVPGARWWDDDVATALTDARGRYRLVDLPAGATRVRVLPPRRSGLGTLWLGGTGDEAGAATMKVRLGRTTSAPDLRLVKGAALRVRVTGAVDPSVAVEAFDRYGRAVGLPALVGKDGRAVLTGLPATAVRVHAWSSSVIRPARGWLGGSTFVTATDVALRAGRTTAVTLPLRRAPAKAGHGPWSASARQPAEPWAAVTGQRP